MEENTREEFEPPPIEQSIKEELDEFVERRIKEGGAPQISNSFFNQSILDNKLSSDCFASP